MNLLLSIAFTFLLGLSPSPSVEVITLKDLASLSEKNGSGIRLINFWASWCGPCVQEIPYLDALNTTGKAEVFFVSLDFIKDLEKVKSLITKKNIQSKVYLLNETDYDKLITQVNPGWSGAIPATLIIDTKGTKHFYEKSFNQKELDELINFYTPK